MACTLQHRPGVLGLREGALDLLRFIARAAAWTVLVVLVLVLLGFAALETGWVKDWLRQTIVQQANRYLNGNLSIQRLRGNILTGLDLEKVVLSHEGQVPVDVEKLTLRYSPLTLISRGLILDSLTLERPTVVLERNDAGWNFFRFVKTRQNTGGGGPPPITFESVVLRDSHVIVRDRGRTIQDVTGLNGSLRFAYLKPGLRISLEDLSARTADLMARRIAGDISTQEGITRVTDLEVETDRSSIRADFDWRRSAPNAAAAGGGPVRPATSLNLSLAAAKLSLPEVALFFKPLAGIPLEPSVNLKAVGTLDNLEMDLRWASSAGNASGPLVANIAGTEKSIEGTLNLQNLNLAPFLKRPDGQTRITGDAGFTLGFGAPGRSQGINASFRFSGPVVQGFGYQAANVRTTGEYRPSLLRFDASGTAYGAVATSKGAFHFPSGGMLSYELDGTFRNLDLRRLPERLSVPEMESLLAGQYEFQSRPGAWSGNARLRESTIEGAAVGEGTVVTAGSQDNVLSYSAAGSLAGLNPARFAQPLELTLLEDPRFQGNLTGMFEMTGSGRSVDELALHTNATVANSAMAGVRFPDARVDALFENRSLTMAFDGAFEELQGSAFSASQVLQETTLNGTANMTLKLALPKSLPVELTELRGKASVASSTVSGVAVDKAFIDGDYADRTANIRGLELYGPTTQGKASGVLALGDTGQSNLTYDLTTSDLEGFAKRFGKPAGGSVHVEGQATGPASDMQFAGKFQGSRLKYGSSVDALALNGRYTGHLPDLDVSRIAVDSDAMGSFITIGGVNLATAEAQLKYADRQLEFRSTLAQESRSLGLEGNALFHPDHNEVHLRALNLMVGQTQWALVPAGEATIRYRNDTFRVDGLLLQRGEQRLLVEGTMAVGAAAGGSSANDLTIRAERVQVRDVNEIMLGRRSLDGIVDLTADVRGTWKDPAVDATFTLVNGSVEGVKFEALAGTAIYEDNRVTLDARLQQTPTAFVTVKGTTPVPGRAPADARVDLDVQSTAVSLGLVQAFTSEVTNVSGEVQGNVHVGGTLEAPSLSGRVNITQAGFAVVATQVAYNNVTARLTLDGDRVLIDRFEISDEDRDRLVALGELGIERRTLGAVNVQLSASRFKVLDNQMGQVEVDADVRVTGDARRPQISGEISTRDGRIEVDRLLERYLSSPYSTEATAFARATAVKTTATQQPAGFETIASTAAPASGTSSSALYDAASINVRIRLPDDLLLRGRAMRAGFAPIGLGDMNITVGGDLQVRKAPGGMPELVGTVSVVRGYYDFQGRRFEVLRDSLIRFEGVQPIDPALRVSGQREITGVTAIVNIRGTVRHPELTLSSSPSLDEADILSLIVFNQPINQLAEGQRLNLAERAATLAAGYLTTPLANSIARALDLDLLDIRAEGDSGQPSVMIGQQFGSRLFVTFREEFGAEDRSQLSLEYRINQFLRLVTSIAQGAQRSHRSQRVEANGTDLIFVIDY